MALAMPFLGWMGIGKFLTAKDLQEREDNVTIERNCGIWKRQMSAELRIERSFPSWDGKKM